ncbi:MAG: YfhO family protein, partial [Clostridia bacterium]|nr:YfhO family protein [Clostridia bacterium]
MEPEKKIEITETAAEETPLDETPEPSEEDLDEAAVQTAKGRARERFKLRLPEEIAKRKYLGLCFLFPALIVFLVYAFRGVYPFGDNSVLVLDLNAQYVYFFSYLRDVFEEGHSLVYCFTRALSGEFMGIYAYYLASPLSWITLLFPADHITEALYLIFVLKSGLCGLTMGWFLDVKGHRNRYGTVAFSVLYALCSYGVVMMHNTMWIDCMILLPLVCRGLEKAVTDRKYKMFILSLALAILSNFYIGYMMVLFVVAYYFYFYYSRSREEINPRGEKFHFTRTTIRVALYGVLAVGIAAVIILPAYTSLQFGKNDFGHPSWGFGEKFEWLDLLTKIFFGTYDTVRPAGLPFIFAGTLTTILVPLYFFVPKIPVRRKMASAFLLLFMVLSFNTTFIDLVWHGFQNPNWLNYRYAFMFVFFAVFCAAQAFEHLKEIKFPYVAIVCSLLLLLLFILQKMDYENVRDLETVWPSAALIVLFLLILRGASLSGKATQKTACTLLVFVVLVEMSASTAYDFICLDSDVVFSSRKGFVEYNQYVEPVVDDLLAKDTSFYRFEKTSMRKTSDNMYLNIRGLSGSTSTLNKSVINFLKQMGLASYSHWTKYMGSSPFLDSLVGIKYIIGGVAESKLPDYYIAGDIYFEDNSPKAKRIYENPYVCSLAFGVSPKILEMDDIVKTETDKDGNVTSSTTRFSSYNSIYERYNDLAKYLLGDTDLPDF